jgi:iron-sulfur cluster assembly accessory protein
MTFGRCSAGPRQIADFFRDLGTGPSSNSIEATGVAESHGYNGASKPLIGVKDDMVQLTEKAVGKVKEIMATQEPAPAGLRIAVVGGGCSGFSYSMAFENQPNMLDKTYSYDGLKVYVDQASMLYLDGAEVDYVESIEGSGFKFNNPHVKSTCGCGSSFQA